ncbi:Mur ligase domain-containing protein, partial [Enterococcus faecium]|uniref:Mur ligase domain-containing protein n=1 Tax=Enterococcus faecium TaxID=1352 RepID=UPI001C556F9A
MSRWMILAPSLIAESNAVSSPVACEKSCCFSTINSPNVFMTQSLNLRMDSGLLTNRQRFRVQCSPKMRAIHRQIHFFWTILSVRICRHSMHSHEKPMRIHILGICGTFMGGLAMLARSLGHDVTGSDANVYPPMS